MDEASYSDLLEPLIEEYRGKTYSFWLPYLSGKPIAQEVFVSDGTRCCVEIQAFWDDKTGGNIRVILSIDDGGLDALSPFSLDFIIGQDGMFVGE